MMMMTCMRPAIPASLDYISVDFYDEHNTNGTHEVALNKVITSM